MQESPTFTNIAATGKRKILVNFNNVTRIQEDPNGCTIYFTGLAHRAIGESTFTDKVTTTLSLDELLDRIP